MSEKKKSLFEEIKLKKRNLLVMKFKIAAGESALLKDIRVSKKEIARLSTKLNDVKI